MIDTFLHRLKLSWELVALKVIVVIIGVWAAFEQFGLHSVEVKIFLSLTIVVILVALQKVYSNYLITRMSFSIKKSEIIAWVSIALLFIILLIMNPFSFLENKLFSKTNLCTLNDECTGWVRIGTADLSDLPITTGTASVVSGFLEKNDATSILELCPKSYENPFRAKASVDIGASFWNHKISVIDDVVQLNLEYSPNQMTAFKTCAENETSCELRQQTVRLYKGQSIRILGCTHYRIGSNDLSDIWVKVRDGNFNYDR